MGGDCGRSWHTDGLRQGKRHPFSILLGVALSATGTIVAAPDATATSGAAATQTSRRIKLDANTLAGNLLVFPGSHHLLHELTCEGGVLRGYEGVKCTGRNAQNPVGLPDLGPPTPVLMAAGDVVVAHSKLAHRGAANMSADIRYMVYFRLRHKRLGQPGSPMQLELNTNLWADMQGAMVQRAVERGRACLSGGGETADESLLQPPSHMQQLRGEDFGNEDDPKDEVAGYTVDDDPKDEVAGYTVEDDGVDDEDDEEEWVQDWQDCGDDDQGGFRLPRLLSEEQVHTFRRDGVLVVPGIMSAREIGIARRGLHTTLHGHGVDVTSAESLRKSAGNLRSLSSTHGAGGVLDLFYPPWKLEASMGMVLNENPTMPQTDEAGEEGSGRMRRWCSALRMAAAMADLYEGTYGQYSDSQSGNGGDGSKSGGVEGATSDVDDNNSRDGGDFVRDLWSHPFGPFEDTRKIFAHVDRVGFRVPDEISRRHSGDGDDESAGDELAGGHRKSENTSKKKAKQRPLQRSLTPHLDCCPHQMYYPLDAYKGTRAGQAERKKGEKEFPRWRPIQCMLALTPCLHAEEGGFEAVKGFHREFDSYYGTTKSAVSAAAPTNTSAVCVGDFSPLRTAKDQDAALLSRVAHVPVPAGAAVFWDQRVAHANSRRHLGRAPREVIYGGYLPRVWANERYAREQRRRFVAAVPPSDFWLHGPRAVTEAAPAATGDIQLDGTECVEGADGGGGLFAHLLGLDLE
jgi:ectoine hydroxylase-related dioxygenase (phytanoyl-CoA dioxygenase family)